MAIVTLGKTSGGGSNQGFLGYSYDVSNLALYDFVTRSTTQLRLFDDSANDFVVTGTGFTYDIDGNFLSGTIATVTLRIGGITEIRVTGLAISAVDLNTAANNGDTWDFFSQLLVGNDTITGTALDDEIIAGNNEGDDTINALGGNDSLNGQTGNDILNGGDGEDWLVGGAGNDTINGGNNFDDVAYLDEYLYQGGTQGIFANLSGVTQGTVLSGTATDSFGDTDTLIDVEQIRGTGFADTIYAADLSAEGERFGMYGFAGNDTFVGSAGKEELFYRWDQLFAQRADEQFGSNLEANLQGIVVDFSADLDGSDGSSGTIVDGFGDTDTATDVERVHGGHLADTFLGGAADERFTGWKGADTINGGGGFDVAIYHRDENGNGITPGSGNVGITADFSGDTTANGSNDGTVVDGFGDTDTLTSIEAIDGTRFNDVMTGGVDDVEFWGDEGNDTLTGGTGNDWLDGGRTGISTEVDTMEGGAGDDGYFVDNINDIVTETFGQGRDKIHTTLNTFSLLPYANIEEVTFRGTGNFTGTGNALSNYIEGGSGNDTLNGGDDADNLNGLGGNDTLNGGADDDGLVGGAGADILNGGSTVTTRHDYDAVFYVDEYLYQGGTQGITVNMSGVTQSGLLNNKAIDAFGTIDTLSDIENIHGTGFNDTVYAANLGTGNNSRFDFQGYMGNDTFVGSVGRDLMDYSRDVEFAQNYEDAGHGILSPTGITVNFAADAILGNGSAGTIIDSFGGTDTVSFVDEVRATFFADTFNGGADNDTFLGLKGNDIINGGSGFDVSAYWDDVLSDSVQTGSSNGITADFSGDVTADGSNDGTVVDAFGDTDTLTSIEVIGGTQFNDVMTGGVDDVEFWGNEGDDTLTGGSGNDWLGGGNSGVLTEVDTMAGGSGDDGYFADSLNDIIVESFDAGVDHIVTSLNSYSLASLGNIENLSFEGTGNFVGVGNAGNNYLEGGSGIDTLTGGEGDDGYRVNSLADTVIELADQGTDRIDTTLNTFSLVGHVNVEWLQFFGTGNFNGTGNNSDNYISGGLGADSLSGGLGEDWLDGFGGIDTMIGGAGDDTYVVDVSGDIVTELAGLGTGTDTINVASTFAAVAGVVTYSIASKANVENLTYLGTNKFTGTGNTLNNTITGGIGNDILDGGVGIDTLIGGDGDDTYTVATAGDTVDETGGSGIDLVKSAISFSLVDGAGQVTGDVENLTLTGALAINGTGNALGNTITGNTGVNIIEGGAGDDVLDGGTGIDTVSYASAGSSVTVVLGGAALTTGNGEAGENDSLKGFENIIGSDHSDTLTGDGLANILNGGADADIMAGGLGNDTYVVDNAGDAITDTGGTADLVLASLDYTLAPNLENLTYDNGVALDGDFIGTGNAAVNKITGGAGADTLDGLGGIDTMIGGAGDDTYVVDVSGDIVTELAGLGTGTDTINVASTFAAVAGVVTYSIASKANVENLTYLGTNKFTGTGNTLNNTITGGIGNDILDGGVGIDTLIGGDGDDTYTVATAGDTVDETGGSGIDLVKSAISFSLVDGAGQVTGDVENLTLTGALAINGTGNALGNTITGNTGVNIIEGGAGDDVLDGGTGIDTVSYASAGSSVTVVLGGAALTTGNGEAGENDSLKGFENIIGSDHSDTLTGDGLANILNGGADADIMAGGLGNDTYVVDNAGDAITDTGGTADLVLASLDYTLAPNLENLTYDNGVALDGDFIGTGNAAVNKITGGAGADTLDGLGGIDTMIGGAGDDTYVVDVSGDIVTELAGLGTGTDTINVASTFAAVAGVVTYSIASKANVENLTYLGTNKFTGTGNTLNNTITGGIGNDILDGGVGIDTLIGGDGDDTYTVATAGDTVDETGGSGIDLVKSAISFSLVDGAGQVTGDVENLTLTGALAINGTGNALGNTITGNTGVNIIEGGAGDDVLDGGTGIDTVSYASAGSSVTVVLGGAALTTGNGEAGENDSLKGFENIIGSDHSDTLTGDGLANILNGGADADIMAGGLGNDTYVVDNAGDAITDTGGTADLVLASLDYTLAPNLENLTYDNGVALDGDFIGTGNAAVNKITGGAGADTLDGLGGIDTMIGGAGDDTYVVDVSGDIVTELAGLGTGTDTINVASTFAAVAGVVTYSIASKANVENLTYLGTNNFTGTGNTLNNTITGGEGADRLAGAAGNDTLVGGHGVDILTGGAQNDTFVFAEAADAGDIVTDFVLGADSFDLTELLAEAALSGYDFDTLVTNGNLVVQASGATGQGTDSAAIANQEVVFDADGTGGVAGIVLFKIEDFTGTLTSDDFILS